MAQNRLYENCKVLCKRKGIAFADFEKNTLNRQAGYLSRKNSMTADELLRAANVLEVGMGALMTHDFKKEYEMIDTLDELRDNIHVLKQMMDKDDLMKVIIKSMNGEVED